MKKYLPELEDIHIITPDGEDLGKSKTDIKIGNRTIHFWRMPSSSRAYPLALDKKVAHYATMLREEGLL